jgi:hypothetical protein
MVAKQGLYHMPFAPSSFYFILFLTYGLNIFAPPSLELVTLTSAYLGAGITGMSHQAQASFKL